MAVIERGEHTIELENGKILVGTTKDLAITLRRLPYTYTMTRIAEILGQTRSNISLALKGTAYGGKLKRRIVVTRNMFRNMRDEEIAEKLSITVLSVATRRRRMKLKSLQKPNLGYRQRLLCQTLFGANYLPSSNFDDIIERLTDKVFQLTNQRNLIMNFYFNGSHSTNTHKVYRHNLRHRMKKYVDENITDEDITYFLMNDILKLKLKN